MFISDEIGLCSLLDRDCEQFYESIGQSTFIVALGIFVLGSLIFVHTRAGRRPWLVSIIVFVLSSILFLSEGSGGGSWGLPDIPVYFGLALILIIGYGAYIMTLILKELLEGKLLLFRKLKTRTLSIIILGLALGTWVLIGMWL